MAKATTISRVPKTSASKTSPTQRKAKPGAAARPSNGLRYRLALACVAVVGAGVLWFGPWLHTPTPTPRGVVTTIAPSKPAPAPAPVAVPTPPPPAAEPASMTAAQEAAFNVWLIGAYRQCWSAPKTMPDGDAYLPKIRVAFKADGGLASPPKLVNPPSDPAWRPHADAALRAVKACDPLHIPDKYAAYYPQWKTKTVYFDPSQP